VLVQDQNDPLLHVIKELTKTKKKTRPKIFSHLQLATQLCHAACACHIFGVNNVQIRAFVNEDSNLKGMDCEQMQRAEILKEWKDLGMQKEDVRTFGRRRGDFHA
jgi:hypothetical protein